MNFGVWLPNCRHLATPDNRPPEELRVGAAEIAWLCRARGRTMLPTLTLRNDVRVLGAGERPPKSAHAGRVLAGEPAALADQITEQMGAFADRVRPSVA